VTSFNELIGNWDTINVTDIQCMFGYATSFNQYWNIKNVKDIALYVSTRKII